MKFKKLLSVILTACITLGASASIAATDSTADQSTDNSPRTVNMGKDGLSAGSTFVLGHGLWSVLNPHKGSGDCYKSGINSVPNEQAMLIINNGVFYQYYNSEVYYDNTAEDKAYSNNYILSDIRKWCSDAAGETKNAYPHKNIESPFSEIERNAMLKTTKNDSLAYENGFYFSGNQLIDDKLFIPSVEEVSTYKNVIQNFYKGDAFWTRTPEYNLNDKLGYAMPSEASYSISTTLPNTTLYALPAFNLNKDAIAFTTAVTASFETDFKKTAVYTDDYYKLTLKDGNDFSQGGYCVGQTTVSSDTKNLALKIFHPTLESVSSSYTNVTAALTDPDGKVIYYGSINTNKLTHQSSLTIPAFENGAGTYTLTVRGEDWNGANNTNYASSTPVTVEIKVIDNADYSDIPEAPIYQSNVGNTIKGYSSTYGYNYIYFGKNNPYKWRVLSDKTNTGSTNGYFMLADDVIDKIAFDSSDNTWQGSDAQAWCQSFSKKGKDFLAYKEIDAIIPTTKTDNQITAGNSNRVFPKTENILNGDLVFFLSAEEATNEAYGLALQTQRIAKGGTYWLRSATTFDLPFIKVVGGVGSDGDIAAIQVQGVYDDANSKYLLQGVRPAFNLKKEQVIYYTSAEKTAPGKFSSITTAAVNEWKTAVKDEYDYSDGGSHYNGTAGTGIVPTIDKTTVKAGSKITITHAPTKNIFREYNYLTASLKDSSGKLLFYGSINEDMNATSSTFTVPFGLEDGGKYTLEIRAEIWKPATFTNYVSRIPFKATLTINESLPDIRGSVNSFGDSGDEALVELIKDGKTIESQSTLKSFKFTGMTSGLYTLRVSKPGHAAENYTFTVYASNVNKSISIWLIGDTNHDGNISVKDLIRLKKIISELSESNGNADLNTDGAVTSEDLAILKKHLI